MYAEHWKTPSGLLSSLFSSLALKQPVPSPSQASIHVLHVDGAFEANRDRENREGFGLH